MLNPKSKKMDLFRAVELRVLDSFCIYVSLLVSFFTYCSF